jgi:hypothetical protein
MENVPWDRGLGFEEAEWRATLPAAAPTATTTLPAVARNRGAGRGKPRGGGSRGAGGGKPGGGEEHRR